MTSLLSMESERQLLSGAWIERRETPVKFTLEIYQNGKWVNHANGLSYTGVSALAHNDSSVVMRFKTQFPMEYDKFCYPSNLVIAMACERQFFTFSPYWKILHEYADFHGLVLNHQYEG